MGCDPRNASRRGVPLKQLPNHLFAQADVMRLAAAVDGTEHVTVSDARAGRPCISGHLYPCWHRDRPNAAMLPNEVHDAPPAIALLAMSDCEGRHLGSSQ